MDRSSKRHLSMNRLTTIIAAAFMAAATASAQTDRIEAFLSDSLDHTEELLEQLENLPNIEVGKGVTFRPKNNSYEMTIRFRMQNMVGLHFNDNIGLTEAEAQVKRLRLRFDGYIFSPKFIYSIPDFQNPSGETLPLEHRRRLVSVARRFGMLIVEDSPYRELRYEGESVPTIYSIDQDITIHLGSFSKIMAPGFRLGWIFGNPDVLDRIYVCKQSLDLCPPVFDQYVAARFISDGSLDRNLAKSIALYRSKRDIMLEMLEQTMPEGVSWTHPEGGLFLFLTLPEGFDSVRFYDIALDAGVAYVAGSFFYPDGGGHNTMRLNFSFMTADRIREGIRLLASLLK